MSGDSSKGRGGSRKVSVTLPLMGRGQDHYRAGGPTDFFFLANLRSLARIFFLTFEMLGIYIVFSRVYIIRRSY